MFASTRQFVGHSLLSLWLGGEWKDCWTRRRLLLVGRIIIRSNRGYRCRHPAPLWPPSSGFFLLLDLGATKNLEDMIKPWSCLAVIMVILWGPWLGGKSSCFLFLDGKVGNIMRILFFFSWLALCSSRVTGDNEAERSLASVLGATPGVGGGLHPVCSPVLGPLSRGIGYFGGAALLSR